MNEIFDNVKLEDIYKKIFVNNAYRNEKILKFIEDTTLLLKNPNDIIMLAPIIKDYLDVSVDNDKLLIEIPKIIQKVNNLSLNSNSGSLTELMNLTEEDVQQIETNLNERLNDITSKTVDKIIQPSSND